METNVVSDQGRPVDHAALLRQYFAQRRSRAASFVGFPFVTISRQAGAGGHTLAREIIREIQHTMPEDVSTGWEVFDHKLCVMLAQDPELNVSFNGLLAEQYRTEVTQFVYELIAGETRQYNTYKKLFEIIRGLATVGKVVIVGRGGNFLTKRMPLGVRIRLVASPETRTQNMMQLLDINKEKAMAQMKEQDRDRSHMIRDFFGKDIEDPLGYDCVINADAVSMQDAAALVAHMVKTKWDRYAKRHV